ncbi:MAG: wax ester/triacylglycerol synthase family O-acyltransferase [Thermoleophilaceae bacterium]|nr:wax ester/triacylglycerol synthase family O-acyltransferase [Thermoleophilaceae bacterium]
MSSKTLPAADAAWLHMDRPTNPMVVNALIWFEEPLDWERTREVVRSRIVDELPRFSQRISERVPGRPRFEDDAEFDLNHHFHRLALPAPGDKAALQELVGDLITPPLDSTRPLWHAYLIENYEGGCAVLFRIHHCIADGIALARVMLSLTDTRPDAGLAPPARSGSNGGGVSLAGLVGPARKVAGAMAHEGMETLAHPKHVRQLAGAAARDAKTVAKLLASPPDADTVLRDPLGGGRAVAWSTPFPLERIKTAAHRGDGTVNDILVAAVTGALRAYLDKHDTVPDDIHIMVPFNLRPLDEPLPRDLGNDFALILLALPVGIADRDERLREVKARMDSIKTSHEGQISYGILNAIGRTLPQVEDQLIRFFTQKASAVVTNVPGPREPVYLAGTPVGGVLVWAPCSGSIGMTVSIFSYAGEVTVGFMADSRLVPDPGPLVTAFDRELRGLCRGTRSRRAPQS